MTSDADAVVKSDANTGVKSAKDAYDDLLRRAQEGEQMVQTADPTVAIVKDDVMPASISMSTLMRKSLTRELDKEELKEGLLLRKASKDSVGRGGAVSVVDPIGFRTSVSVADGKDNLTKSGEVRSDSIGRGGSNVDPNTALSVVVTQRRSSRHDAADLDFADALCKATGYFDDDSNESCLGEITSSVVMGQGSGFRASGGAGISFPGLAGNVRMPPRRMSSSRLEGLAPVQGMTVAEMEFTASSGMKVFRGEAGSALGKGGKGSMIYGADDAVYGFDHDLIENVGPASAGNAAKSETSGMAPNSGGERPVFKKQVTMAIDDDDDDGGDVKFGVKKLELNISTDDRASEGSTPRALKCEDQGVVKEVASTTSDSPPAARKTMMWNPLRKSVVRLGKATGLRRTSVDSEATDDGGLVADIIDMNPSKGWAVLKRTVMKRAVLMDVSDKYNVRESLNLSPHQRKQKTMRQKTMKARKLEECDSDPPKGCVAQFFAVVFGINKERKDIFHSSMFEPAFDLEKVSFEFFEIRETDPAQFTETAKFHAVKKVNMDPAQLSFINRTFIRKDGWVVRQSHSDWPDFLFRLNFWFTWWNVWFVFLYLGFNIVWPKGMHTFYIDLPGETLYFFGIVILPLRTTILNLEDGREHLDLQFIWDVITRSRIYQVGALTCLSWLWWLDTPGEETFWMYFGLLRLLRIWGALKWKAKKVVDRASSAVILQSVATNLSLEIIFGTHILAVLWFRAVWEIDGKQTYGLNHDVASGADYYILAMRDCILLLGGSPPPSMSVTTNVTLSLIVAIASPLCIVIIAVVLADIVLIKQSWNILQTRIIEEKSLVNATMSALGLPGLLKSRIIEYQRFVDLQFGNEGARNNLYSRMNALLELEVKIYLFSGLIERAPFFSNIHAWGIAEIIANFCEEFYSPGDFVIRLGQEGREMYFILKGRCEILVRDQEQIAMLQSEDPDEPIKHFPKKVLTAKKAGDYFGEVALVKDGAIRSAYVRAQTYCVLEKLHGHVLHSVVRNKFPDAYAEIVQRILGFTNVSDRKFKEEESIAEKFSQPAPTNNNRSTRLVSQGSGVMSRPSFGVGRQNSAQLGVGIAGSRTSNRGSPLTGDDGGRNSVGSAPDYDFDPDEFAVKSATDMNAVSLQGSKDSRSDQTPRSEPAPKTPDN